MKILIEIDDEIHSVESNNPNSKDLYHMILHFKGLLMGIGHSEEKIDGCLKGALETHLIHNSN
jgi:hypothetical protein